MGKTVRLSRIWHGSHDAPAIGAILPSLRRYDAPTLIVIAVIIAVALWALGIARLMASSSVALSVPTSIGATDGLPSTSIGTHAGASPVTEVQTSTTATGTHQADLTINGRTEQLPADGTVSKTITTQGGTTRINVTNHDTSTGSGQTQSTMSVNVNSSTMP